MTLTIPIPGATSLELDHVVMDVNGTLTDRGRLIAGVRQRILALRERCTIHLASADTFGTLDQLADSLNIDAVRVRTGDDKRELIARLGAHGCAVLGNGTNDASALEESALGIAVLGPEGASGRALRAADLVCASVTAALDLLLDPRALAATLRP